MTDAIIPSKTLRAAMPRLVFILALLCPLGAAQLAAGVETIRFRDGGGEQTATGKILVEAQDGGVMLLGNDGRIWTILPAQVLDRTTSDGEFEPIRVDEAEQRLREELPGDFKIHRTSHYIIAYNSNEAYAKTVGRLFEQLYRGFFTYWRNQRWELPDPEFPLVALVLKDRRSFLNYAGAEIGDTANSVIGYYHLSNNRMMTYNVASTFERNVSTIIHEATHQLAYNCGLQRRYADNPMWVSEGLAMYFESPDRRNPKQWRRIGQLNQVNLARWRRYEPVRPQESLATLLSDDALYSNAATAEAAYAEGWALTYFLIKTRRKLYVKYLQMLSEGRPLAERTRRERIEMFETAFGTTLVELDQAFVKFMGRQRLK